MNNEISQDHEISDSQSAGNDNAENSGANPSAASDTFPRDSVLKSGQKPLEETKAAIKGAASDIHAIHAILIDQGPIDAGSTAGAAGDTIEPVRAQAPLAEKSAEEPTVDWAKRRTRAEHHTRRIGAVRAAYALRNTQLQADAGVLIEWRQKLADADLADAKKSAEFADHSGLVASQYLDYVRAIAANQEIRGQEREDQAMAWLTPKEHAFLAAASENHTLDIKLYPHQPARLLMLGQELLREAQEQLDRLNKQQSSIKPLLGVIHEHRRLDRRMELITVYAYSEQQLRILSSLNTQLAEIRQSVEGSKQADAAWLLAQESYDKGRQALTQDMPALTRVFNAERELVIASFESLHHLAPEIVRQQTVIDNAERAVKAANIKLKSVEAELAHVKEVHQYAQLRYDTCADFIQTLDLAQAKLAEPGLTYDQVPIVKVPDLLKKNLAEISTESQYGWMGGPDEILAGFEKLLVTIRKAADEWDENLPDDHRRTRIAPEDQGEVFGYLFDHFSRVQGHADCFYFNGVDGVGKDIQDIQIILDEGNKKIVQYRTRTKLLPILKKNWKPYIGAYRDLRQFIDFLEGQIKFHKVRMMELVPQLNQRLAEMRPAAVAMAADQQQQLASAEAEVVKIGLDHQKALETMNAYSAHHQELYAGLSQTWLQAHTQAQPISTHVKNGPQLILPLGFHQVEPRRLSEAWPKHLEAIEQSISQTIEAWIAAEEDLKRQLAQRKAEVLDLGRRASSAKLNSGRGLKTYQKARQAAMLVARTLDSTTESSHFINALLVRLSEDEPCTPEQLNAVANVLIAALGTQSALTSELRDELRATYSGANPNDTLPTLDEQRRKTVLSLKQSEAKLASAFADLGEQDIENQDSELDLLSWPPFDAEPTSLLGWITLDQRFSEEIEQLESQAEAVDPDNALTAMQAAVDAALAHNAGRIERLAQLGDRWQTALDEAIEKANAASAAEATQDVPDATPSTAPDVMADAGGDPQTDSD